MEYLLELLESEIHKNENIVVKIDVLRKKPVFLRMSHKITKITRV